jgi:hypothetical protein
MNESGRRSMETAEWAAGPGTSLYVGPAATNCGAERRMEI